MRNLIAFVVGLIFALGLGYSGMTKPHIVRGFLDFLGEWDYTLMGVMMGAIAVHSIVFFIFKHRPSPLLDVKFHLPTKKEIDGRLLLGAVIFGLGWGWAGICPGPGIVSLISGDKNIFFFILSMIFGMWFFKLVEKKIQ